MASVSSTTSSTVAQNNQTNVLKKTENVVEQQVLKLLESTNQQTQQATAQKTGMGGNINILA